MGIVRSLVFAGLIGHTFTVLGQDSRMSDHSKEALKNAVEVATLISDSRANRSG